MAHQGIILRPMRDVFGVQKSSIANCFRTTRPLASWDCIKWLFPAKSITTCLVTVGGIVDRKYVYTSFEGRIGIRTFWIAAMTLVVAVIVIPFLLAAIFGPSSFNPSGNPDAKMDVRTTAVSLHSASMIILAWPMLAIAIKRRHDRGRAGGAVWVYAVLVVLHAHLETSGIGYWLQTTLGAARIETMWVLRPVTELLGFYLLFVMGFLKGDPGPNAYGPDPSSST